MCVIIISDRIGEVMDTEEREYYNFLPAIKDFQEVRFLQLDDTSYVIEITHLQDSVETIRRISQTQEEIDQLRILISHIEQNYDREITKIRTQYDSKPPFEQPAYSPEFSRLRFWVNFGLGTGSMSMHGVIAVAVQYKGLYLSLQSTAGSSGFWSGDSKESYGLLGGVSTKRKYSPFYYSLAGGIGYSRIYKYISGGLFEPLRGETYSSLAIILEGNAFIKAIPGIGLGLCGFIDFSDNLTMCGLCLCVELGY